MARRPPEDVIAALDNEWDRRTREIQEERRREDEERRELRKVKWGFWLYEFQSWQMETLCAGMYWTMMMMFFHVLYTMVELDYLSGVPLW